MRSVGRTATGGLALFLTLPAFALLAATPASAEPESSEPPNSIESYAILATDSLWLGRGSSVESGHVGVNQAGKQWRVRRRSGRSHPQMTNGASDNDRRHVEPNDPDMFADTYNIQPTFVSTRARTARPPTPRRRRSDRHRVPGRVAARWMALSPANAPRRMTRNVRQSSATMTLRMPPGAPNSRASRLAPCPELTDLPLRG